MTSIPDQPTASQPQIFRRGGPKPDRESTQYDNDEFVSQIATWAQRASFKTRDYQGLRMMTRAAYSYSESGAATYHGTYQEHPFAAASVGVAGVLNAGPFITRPLGAMKTAIDWSNERRGPAHERGCRQALRALGRTYTAADVLQALNVPDHEANHNAMPIVADRDAYSDGHMALYSAARSARIAEEAITELASQQNRAFESAFLDEMGASAEFIAEFNAQYAGIARPVAYPYEVHNAHSYLESLGSAYDSTLARANRAGAHEKIQLLADAKLESDGCEQSLDQQAYANLRVEAGMLLSRRFDLASEVPDGQVGRQAAEDITQLGDVRVREFEDQRALNGRLADQQTELADSLSQLADEIDGPSRLTETQRQALNLRVAGVLQNFADDYATGISDQQRLDSIAHQFECDLADETARHFTTQADQADERAAQADPENAVPDEEHAGWNASEYRAAETYWTNRRKQTDVYKSLIDRSSQRGADLADQAAELARKYTDPDTAPALDPEAMRAVAVDFSRIGEWIRDESGHRAMGLSNAMGLDRLDGPPAGPTASPPTVDAERVPQPAQVANSGVAKLTSRTVGSPAQGGEGDPAPRRAQPRRSDPTRAPDRE